MALALEGALNFFEIMACAFRAGGGELSIGNN